MTWREYHPRPHPTEDHNPTRQVLDLVTFMCDGATAETVLTKAGAK